MNSVFLGLDQNLFTLSDLMSSLMQFSSVLVFDLKYDLKHLFTLEIYNFC
jgi:hypothetical protein